MLNAAQIANGSGRADKALAVDTAARRATLRETNGFQGGRPVRYVSTDASDEAAAALEDATYAPALNAAPPGPVQRDWDDIEGLVAHGRITGPGGAPFGPGGFIVDCPIVFRAG